MTDDTNQLNEAYSAWQDRQDYYESRGLYWDRDAWRYEPQYPEDLESKAPQYPPGAMRRDELSHTAEGCTSYEEF